MMRSARRERHLLYTTGQLQREFTQLAFAENKLLGEIILVHKYKESGPG